jgi:tetratricopeptide (TPR) repeat protein
MQMTKLLVAMIFAAVFSVNAAAPPRGADRLRELVVFPQMNFNFNWGISCQNNEWVISRNVDLPNAIAEQREKLKRQPDDVRQLMHLAYLLDSNGETNESQSCYQKAGQLCRDKVAANPQDGLSLMTLGVTLDALGKEDEAEHDFRKAALVSSNEWRCWTGLGNFLEGNSFDSMFSKDLRNAVGPGQVPSQSVLDYRPAPETLKKSEAMRDEASRCFDRAMVLAPKEPGMLFQCAGYMSMSNLQNCYIRHYRDNEKITTNEWLSAFFSKGTIANLQKASELKPKDYQYVSLAANFEWYNAALQNSATFDLDPNTLPDAARQFIHDSMTRLENLSKDTDNKTAAGALENLGMLNMMFGNKPEATTDFRRAVALDPTREQSWDLLLGMLLDSASPDELLAAAEARLKIEDSARNHIVLSKVLAQKMRKWKEASEQAEIAEKLETNNIVPPLMLAAIALKQSEQTNYLSIARSNLARAYIIQQKMPENDENWKRTREWGLNTIIFYALNDQLDSAKNTANKFLKLFPDDKTVKEILTMLN